MDGQCGSGCHRREASVQFGLKHAAVIMVPQAAMALGRMIWGYAVATTRTTYMLLGAGVLFLISLALADPLLINFTAPLNFDPAPVTGFSHRLIFTPQPHDGPVSITVEFKVYCAHGQEFTFRKFQQRGKLVLSG